MGRISIMLRLVEQVQPRVNQNVYVFTALKNKPKHIKCSEMQKKKKKKCT